MATPHFKLRGLIAVTQMVLADFLVKHNRQRFGNNELEQGYQLTFGSVPAEAVETVADKDATTKLLVSKETTEAVSYQAPVDDAPTYDIWVSAADYEGIFEQVELVEPDTKDETAE